MSNNGHIDNFYTPARLENLRKIFLTIKKKTNEILLPYDDVSYIKNPSVDIETIALKNGIIKIERVPPGDIPEKHAILKNSIIKVNKRDNRREQRFSIAHEMEHQFKQLADEQEKVDYSTKTIFSMFTRKFYKQYKRMAKDATKEELRPSARSNYKSLVKKLKKSPNFNNIAVYIAKTVSYNLGKYIFPDKALNIIAKILYNEPDKIKKLLEDEFIRDAIDELYNEEIADYFAANLLVPTERFILWEDKSDGRIARKFKVPKACIKKRREEIPFEIDFMTINNSDFGDNIV